MTAAIAYHAAAGVERVLGRDPMEPVEPPVGVDVDEREESRPVDIDACELCGGDGCYEIRDWLGGSGLMVDVTCPSCGGTGERRWTA